MTPRKKLIEVALPLDAINKASAREKSIRRLGRSGSVPGVRAEPSGRPREQSSRLETHRVQYLRRPFGREPDFGVTSVNYDFSELLARAEAPS